jgi:predicted cupin superfamily sugar epimerase
MHQTAKAIIEKLNLSPLPCEGSALHRVRSDELFHFYAGDAVEMVQIDFAGRLTTHAIGAEVLAGELPQVLVPKNFWQGLRLKAGGEWCLMGTTVSPGFEYEDFELGERAKLVAQFPALAVEIEKFTRAGGLS